MKQTIILVLVACVLILSLIQLVTSSNRGLNTEVADLSDGQEQLAVNVTELQKETVKLRQSVKRLETSIENLEYSMWRAAGTRGDTGTMIDVAGDTATPDVVALQEELSAMSASIERLRGEVSRGNRGNDFQNMRDLVNDPEKFSVQLDKLAAGYANNIDDANQQYAFKQDIEKLKEMAGMIDDPNLYNYVNNMLQERLATTNSTRMQERLTRAQESLTTLEGDELQSQLERISTFTTMFEVREVSERYNIPPETMQAYGLPTQMFGRGGRGR